MSATINIDHGDSFGARLGLLAKLAWPTMASRAGIMAMVFVDIVMVGRHSTQELAYAALGMSLFVPMLVSGIGLVLGAAILTAQHYGAGELTKTGVVLRRALPWGVAIGAIGAVILYFGETWLLLLGHDPDLAAGGGAVAQAVALGLPAQMLFVAFAFHLEATRRPIPGMIAMIAANVLNLALNWVFIYGNLGAPELGAVGSAVTTAAVRLFLFLALAGYVFTRLDSAAYGIDARNFSLASLRPRTFWGAGGWRGAAGFRRLGYAAGVSYGIETTAFAAVLQFAGWLGEDALAAYSIAHNLQSVFFMIALGLGSATAVLVGNAIGARDRARAAAAGRLGVGAVLVMMACCAAFIWATAPEIAGIYSNDPTLRALAQPILLVAAAAVIFDGAQLVAAQASRAMGDVWATTARHAIAFFGVMTPLAYLFAITFEFGGVGLMMAVFVGSLVSLVLHWMRFQTLCAQPASAALALSRPGKAAR